ncbi:MAG: FAD-binding oxidoreductase [Campylobacteraceae bacterium]|nr:FAD-binding oxidoreductase [Campylobacteraceae bacterium]
MKKDIVIIGGGIVGLMSAYFLLKENQDILLIDKNEITSGASFGNAGLLSAFSKNPLSSPGVVVSTFKLMLKGESPVTLHPSLDIKLYYWLYAFMKNANYKRLNKTLALFEKYGEKAINSYKKMKKEDDMDFYFKEDGLLMVYTQEKSFQDKIKISSNKDLYTILNKSETKKYLPFVNDKIIGSVLLKQNAHLDPSLLMSELKSYLLKKGVEFVLNEEVLDFKFKKNKITKVYTEKNFYEANTFILASGANDSLFKKTNNSFLMTKAKGYSLTFEMKEQLKPKTAALFADLFIALTPRDKTVRITSKLELGSNDEKIVKKQIDSIKNNLFLYTKDFEMKNIVEWSGFRPLCPDDMPILGFDKTYVNLVHANGLGWLGITFGPAIGEIISDLVCIHKENKKSDDILLFSQFYQV